jgi:hypothetical protein
MAGHRLTFKSHFYGTEMEDLLIALYRRYAKHQVKLLLGSLAFWFSKGIQASTIKLALGNISNAKNEKFISMDAIYDEVRKCHSQIPLEF